MLERHQHADVAARRIDGADESDDGDPDEILAGQAEAGRDHQGRAGEQQVAQLVARGEHADAEREKRRAEERRRRDDADFGGAEADRHQIGRQHDGGEAVAETAHAARHEQQQNVRRS